MSRGLVLAGLVALLLAVSFSFANTVGTASITAPAVITESGMGSLTQINVTVTNGHGNVTVSGVQVVGNDTLQSAITAAQYASMYSRVNFSNYNFNYRIDSASDNVSGPSAGAAMTLLAISALTHQQFRPNFTITGTISQSGAIGEVGGVYDKTEAAAQDGFKFIMVPAVSGSNPEDALYALVQANFGIPLVQVANITQAAGFAFNPNANYSAHKTVYNPYVNYYAGQLPTATLQCSNSCNTTYFNMLVAQTYNLTRGEISQLSGVSGFANISMQLNKTLMQSEAIGNLGYRYTGADLAFLDYITAYYFNNHNTNKAQALTTMSNVQSYCDSLAVPQLTSTNYEDVISAELRQEWANYSISSAINTYNATAIDTDGILSDVYAAGESYAWCHAANILYTLYSNSTGSYVNVSQSLKTVAFGRLDRAAAYGSNMYTLSAAQAYKQGNYPVAILDSDYAYAFGIAGARQSSLNKTSALDNASIGIAANSTYGTWATEFSKEAQFYVAESRLAPNSTAALGYAQQAYSTSLLAQQVSNDTMLIRNSLVASSVQNPSLQTSRIISYINSLDTIVLAILVIVVILLILTISLVIGVMMALHRHVKNTEPRSHARNRRKR